MPSPDVSPTVDLTVFDSTASDLADRAASNLESVLPEAALPLGSLEMVLIESLALLVQEIGYALNRIPGAVLESLLARLYAIPRSPGVLPTASVELTADAAGASIPVGTLVQVSVGDEIVQLTTDAELTITAGTPSAVVGITGTEFTDLANGIPSGTPVDLITDTTGVTAAVLSQDVGGGAGPEDADAYLDRAGIRLQRLTATLLQPEQFEAYAIEQPGVYRVKAVNLYNSDTAVAGGGHLSVASLDSSGAPLSAPAKATLLTGMDDLSAAFLGVHAFDPTITTVPVTATLHTVPGADTTVVHDAAVAALDAYLSPLTWGWGSTVRRNELIALLEAVEGVDYLTAGHPTAPAGDTALTGQAPLADLGTTTITVV